MSIVRGYEYGHFVLRSLEEMLLCMVIQKYILVAVHTRERIFP